MGKIENKTVLTSNKLGKESSRRLKIAKAKKEDKQKYRKADLRNKEFYRDSDEYKEKKAQKKANAEEQRKQQKLLNERTFKFEIDNMKSTKDAIFYFKRLCIFNNLDYGQELIKMIKAFNKQDSLKKP